MASPGRCSYLPLKSASISVHQRFLSERFGSVRALHRKRIRDARNLVVGDDGGVISHTRHCDIGGIQDVSRANTHRQVSREPPACTGVEIGAMPSVILTAEIGWHVVNPVGVYVAAKTSQRVINAATHRVRCK